MYSCKYQAYKFGSRDQEKNLTGQPTCRLTHGILVLAITNIYGHLGSVIKKERFKDKGIGKTFSLKN